MTNHNDHTDTTTQERDSTYAKMQDSLKQEPKASSPSHTDDQAPQSDKAPSDTQDTQEETLQATIAQLKAELKQAKQEAHDQKIRSLAEISNLQDRYKREADKTKAYAITSFAKHLLDVGDALEQGISSCQDPQQKDGLEMIWKIFASALAKSDIDIIKPLGELYDPHLHEAMVMQPSDKTHNSIVQVIQTGYKLKERLLRPARVIVAQNNSTEKNT